MKKLNELTLIEAIEGLKRGEFSSKEITEVCLNTIKEKEEDMIKYQREAEKETLNVLNGVNKVLELSDKMKENDTNKIIGAINSLEDKIKK